MRPVDGGIATIEAKVLNVREAALAGSAVCRIFFDVSNGVRPGVGSLECGEVAQLGTEHRLKCVIGGMPVAAEVVDGSEVACWAQGVDAGRGSGSCTVQE